MTTIDDLPESLLLVIFNRLNYRDLCKCSMVCYKWHRISKDITLKKVIDLSSFQLSRYHFQSFIRHHASPLLRQICLRGIAKPHAFLLEELFLRSPFLEKLYLLKNTSQQFFNYLPVSLVHLSVRGCHAIDIDKLVHIIVDNSPYLRCLDLSGVLFLTSNDLYHVTKLKSLRALYLEGCMRVNNGGMEEIIDILPQLEILDVELTDVSNNGLQVILEHCINLKQLYVGRTNVDDNVFSRMAYASQLPLQKVCLYDTHFSIDGIRNFIENVRPQKHKLTLITDQCFMDNNFMEGNVHHVNFVVQMPLRKCCHHVKFHKC